MNDKKIKFRAWDAAIKCFNPTVAGNLLMQMHEPSENVDPEYGTRFFLDEFIGKQDFNGVDIYENDIIPCKVGVQNYSGWVVGDPDATLNGVIQWNPYQLCWQVGFNQPNKYNIISMTFGWGNNPDFIIIGNTHQNPDLICH